MAQILNAARLDYTQLGSSFTKNANAVITKVENLVTFTKVAAPTTATSGTVVTYTINIIPSAETTNITAANLKDTLPSTLTLVANSLKVNGVANSGNIITGIPLTLTAGTTTTVEYKCTVV